MIIHHNTCPSCSNKELKNFLCTKDFSFSQEDYQIVQCNTCNNKKDFVPGKNSVYYSGPYWDDLEIREVIYSILKGKWLSSGERVNKFEIEFSKKFNFKYSVMVNSGSSANLVMFAALKKHFGWKDGDEIILS